KALLSDRPWTMWRYREWLPLGDGESPVTLGEGGTPLLAVQRIAARYGFEDLCVKEESVNPTGTFKARGLAAAVTRAAHAGARRVNVATLREPDRIEGKKTRGLELAEQFGWTLPDVIVYPTGGGTGLIGMWKAFGELAGAGWVGESRPRMYGVQAAGCAPVVK